MNSLKCQCTTKIGEQCKNKPTNGSQFCYIHIKKCDNLFKNIDHPKQQIEVTKDIITVKPKQQIEVTKDIITTNPEPKPRFRRVSVLGGSANMALYNNINGRRVLMLGESHTPFKGQKNCKIPINNDGFYKIVDWFEDIAKSAPHCVDLLLELDYSPYVQGKYNPSPLTEVHDRFNNISYGNKTEIEKSGHLRFHNVDLRVIGNLSYGLLGLQNNYNGEEKLSKYLYPYFQEFLDYLLCLKTENTSDVSKKFEDLVVHYQKSTIGIKNTKGIILNHNKYMELYFIRIKKALSKLDPSIDQLRLLKAIKTAYIFVISEYSMRSIINCVPMDLYLLLKLFTKFQLKDRGSKDCQSQIMDYAIIFVGSYHFHMYRNIIYSYFEILPTQKYLTTDQLEASKYSCVPFDEPFDFFV